MWCDNCQQDVPGIASFAESEEVVCCARCGESLPSASATSGHSPAEPPTLAATDEFATDDMPAWDDWELDEQLYDVDRLLSEIGGGSENAMSARSHPWPAGSVEVMSNQRTSAAAAGMSPERKPRRRKRSSWLAWLVLSLSLMTFVCGSVLLGWSFFTDKTLLWRIGMPLSLVGQAGLLIGLILQLEGLWQNDHEATETLDELDEQIRELRQAAAMLNATHSRPGQSFYLHMAEGASPHLMLADLKSQLDLLAVQMEKQRR